MPLHKHVSEENDMFKLLGAEKDPDSVSVMPNFKGSISFYNVKVHIWRESMQTDGRIEARKWPVGVQEEKYVPWPP
jgi:hypothetical protein